MSLLLDTHVLLWALVNDPTLAEPARRAITDASNSVLVSAVSAWEITIKRRSASCERRTTLSTNSPKRRFTTLDVTIHHALAVGELPTTMPTRSTDCSSPRRA